MAEMLRQPGRRPGAKDRGDLRWPSPWTVLATRRRSPPPSARGGRRLGEHRFDDQHSVVKTSGVEIHGTIYADQ
jgi:hypothetical protein